MVNRSLALPDLDSFAAELAGRLQPGMALLLEGPLGAGKTTLSRAVIQSLTGEEVEVQSPTFPLCLTYDAPKATIWHYDLYRLQPGADLEALGWYEARDKGIAIVEWPDRAARIDPPYMRLTIAFGTGETDRVVTIEERV